MDCVTKPFIFQDHTKRRNEDEKLIRTPNMSTFPIKPKPIMFTLLFFNQTRLFVLLPLEIRYNLNLIIYLRRLPTINVFCLILGCPSGVRLDSWDVVVVLFHNSLISSRVFLKLPQINSCYQFENSPRWTSLASVHLSLHYQFRSALFLCTCSFFAETERKYLEM